MNSTSSDHATTSSGRAALRFGGVFALIALVGFALELHPWVNARVIKPYTEGLAWLVGHLVQGVGGDVLISGVTLRHPDGFAIAISNGCSGVEAVILLAGAIIAFPTSWRSRAWGLLLGSLALQGLNVLRVISLFFIGQYSQAWFDWAHQYAWDVLIVVDGLVVFLLWIRQLPSHARYSVN